MKNVLFSLICLYLVSSCGQANNKRFELLTAEETGIDFTNQLRPSSEFNILEYLYYYNGGGVSAGDINNDGLIDLFFTSNQESNQL